jgi:hypothetical protein
MNIEHTSNTSIIDIKIDFVPLSLHQGENLHLKIEIGIKIS